MNIGISHNLTFVSRKGNKIVEEARKFQPKDTSDIIAGKFASSIILSKINNANIETPRQSSSWSI